MKIHGNQMVRLLNGLKRFEHDFSGADCMWNILFPDQRGNWNYLRITKYRDTACLIHMDRDLPGLEVAPGERAKTLSGFGQAVCLDEDSVSEQWNLLAADACSWLTKAEKDWIRSNQRVQIEYPLERRYGIVPHMLVRASLKDIRRVDEELGKRSCRKFIRRVEKRIPSGGLDGAVVQSWSLVLRGILVETAD